MVVGFFLLRERFDKAAFAGCYCLKSGLGALCCNGVMATPQLKWSGRKAGLDLT